MIALTLLYSPMLLYESLLSHVFINKKIKEKKIEKKINIDLAILPSHDTIPLLSFFVLRNFSYNS